MTEPTGAVTGTGAAPDRRQASQPPIMTKTSELTMIAGTGITGLPCSTTPVIGSSQLVNAPFIISKPPRATDPTAKIILGYVIREGDSFVFCCYAYRLSPM